MTCSRCGHRLKSGDGFTCPKCGTALVVTKSGVMKSSTILISAGETEAVYRSVKEVPAPLRRKLLKSTNGLNAATILIADRRGREEIARAIRHLPASLQRRFLKPFREEFEAPTLHPRVRFIVAALLGAASMLVVWFVFTHKWR